MGSDLATNSISSGVSHLPTDATIDFDAKAVASQMMNDALKPVSSYLKHFENVVTEYLTCESKTSNDVVKHVFSNPGKRIRPALYFFCCELVKYNGPHLYPIAAVCEYVHTASLLHDDVVDNSSLRRNKPTANSIWGDQASVLVGDLIYSTASEMMAATGSLDIVKGFARAIRLMSEGELLQLEACFNPNADEDTYHKIIYCKTSALIAMSCRSAALLAKANPETEQALYNFGKKLGMAFQLIDDALDYVGNRELFGKPTLSDLREGKVTLPLILVLQNASAEDAAILRGIIAKPSISKEDISLASKLVERYDTAEATVARANQYTDEAIASLDIFADSVAKANLVNIAKRLVWRFT